MKIHNHTERCWVDSRNQDQVFKTCGYVDVYEALALYLDEWVKVRGVRGLKHG